MPVKKTEITVVEHGKYQIKARKEGREFLARAFFKPPAKTKGIVAEATGKDLNAAIEEIKEKLGTEQEGRQSRRRWCEETRFHVPLLEEYITALQQTPLSVKDTQMLRAHAAAGDDGLTSRDLAKAAGYKSLDSALRSYGKLGRRIGEVIDVTAPESSQNGSDNPAGVLATEVSRDAEGATWVMYPELREAVLEVLVEDPDTAT